MLKIGTKAPDFKLKDQNGDEHTLKDYAGRKLLVFFYSKDNTSGCTKQAVAYSGLKERFAEKGITVVGVSKDSAASHKRFEEKQGLTVTLLADPELEMIKAYDVWKEKKLYGNVSMGVLRTTYVIDGNGIIVFANDKVKAAEDAAKMIEL
ncbi:MAG: peroxiredoxin [Clostridia bacterium]|jgi:peroxiredoxin Q/BCP|nr:peroxiredoxin [Clostridia bacterium]MBQ3895143.1 peroxiredoxin [Clostridia bacterium]MBR5007320.1 peroxiredoxin [Clostridia bacterium]